MEDSSQKWTAVLLIQSILIFLFAGLAEICGGWLVWQGVREGRTKWLCVAGAAILIAYGFIPTLQPEFASFGRVYAAYGGFFIVLSYAWGWAIDGDRPDAGDFTGAAIALAGILLAWFWPRGSEGVSSSIADGTSASAPPSSSALELSPS